MLPVEIQAIQGTLILRARGSELLITPNHVATLRDLKQPSEFTQYFLSDALINRPARKLFEAWLRKDNSLWQRLYNKVQKELEDADIEAEAVEKPKAPKVVAAKEVKETKEKAAAPAKKAETKPAAEEKKAATKKVAAKKEPEEKKTTTKTAAKKEEKPTATKKAAAKSTAKVAAPAKKAAPATKKTAAKSASKSSPKKKK